MPKTNRCIGTFIRSVSTTFPQTFISFTAPLSSLVDFLAINYVAISSQPEELFTIHCCRPRPPLSSSQKWTLNPYTELPRGLCADFELAYLAIETDFTGFNFENCHVHFLSPGKADDKTTTCKSISAPVPRRAAAALSPSCLRGKCGNSSSLFRSSSKILSRAAHARVLQGLLIPSLPRGHVGRQAGAGGREEDFCKWQARCEEEAPPTDRPTDFYLFSVFSSWRSCGLIVKRRATRKGFLINFIGLLLPQCHCMHFCLKSTTGVQLITIGALQLQVMSWTIMEGGVKWDKVNLKLNDDTLQTAASSFFRVFFLPSFLLQRISTLQLGE